MIIPKQLQESSFGFVLLRKWDAVNPEGKPTGKNAFEESWQTNFHSFDSPKLKAHLEKGWNYGVQCGLNNLKVRDIDDSVFAQELINSGKIDTFAVKTGKGVHLYYKSDYNPLNEQGEPARFKVLTNGEIRLSNCYVVAPNSKHPNGNIYTVISDLPIKEISGEELEALWVKPYEKPTHSIITNTPIVDESRSGREFGEVCKLIRKGLSDTEIEKHMQAFSKWKESKQQYKTYTLKKARLTIQREVELNKQVQGIIPKSFDYKKELVLWQFNDFVKLKEDKSYVIQQVIYPKTVTMLYSPPGEFKSLLALYAGLAIATGKEWLGFKTKKAPVLYCDKENNDQIIKKRIQGLHKGALCKRKKFPLYFLRRHGDLLDQDFIQRLKEAVAKNKIKVVFFDTLHRFADYDENSSDDLNRIYTYVFQPLVEEFGCSIVFLHHSKKDGGYRGTGDFLGMVDTAYSVQREKSSNKKLNRFTIVNEKSRAGEIEQIKGEIDFSDDDSYIKFVRLNELVEEGNKISELKQVTAKIQEFVQDGSKVKRKDIEGMFDMANVQYSIATLKRSLKWLVDNRYFDYDDSKHEYWKVLR